MGLKPRLILMVFLQFFIWGAWLLTIGAYWFQGRHWSGAGFGAIFSTMGISALFMPSLAGFIADRWINAERLYGALHVGGAIALLAVPMAGSPGALFWTMLANMLCYMPTLSLAIAIAYNALRQGGHDVVRAYPPIRVWGTAGFIVALWTTSLLRLETSAGQFHLAAAASLALGLYAFTLPPCPPRAGSTPRRAAFGWNSFAMLRDPRMATFLLFAILLGACLQLTNAYGDTFLHDFAGDPRFADALAVRYPAIVMSVSQMSETLFILAIPFALLRFGIKWVMAASMFAWALRFALFAFGDPGAGLWMILLSCVVYGMAFDFFNISGSLFVESQGDPAHRASAQGLYMLATNGIGAVLGSALSGLAIDRWFTRAGGAKDWHGIWLAFAAFAFATAVLFVVSFRFPHERTVPMEAGRG